MGDPPAAIVLPAVVRASVEALTVAVPAVLEAMRTPKSRLPALTTDSGATVVAVPVAVPVSADAALAAPAIVSSAVTKSAVRIWRR
jgi:hypothetical protein